MYVSTGATCCPAREPTSYHNGCCRRVLTSPWCLRRDDECVPAALGIGCACRRRRPSCTRRLQKLQVSLSRARTYRSGPNLTSDVGVLCQLAPTPGDLPVGPANRTSIARMHDSSARVRSRTQERTSGAAYTPPRRAAVSAARMRAPMARRSLWTSVLRSWTPRGPPSRPSISAIRMRF